MKKISIILTILALAAFTVSCETYDDYETARKTVVGFSTASKNINGIPEGGSKSTTVNVFSSDAAGVDRTFTVVAVPSREEPATAPDNYTFDPTVLIPANTRVGEITVTGVDNSLTSDRSYFSLAIESGANIVSGGVVTIGLKN